MKPVTIAVLFTASCGAGVTTDCLSDSDCLNNQHCEPKTRVCVGNITTGETNGCGGTAYLDSEPGDACDFVGEVDLDECDDDVYECAGANATVCVNVAHDADGDNYSAGAADCAGDCDDADGARHSGLTEICNNKDDDCDDATPEGTDEDGDGYCAEGDNLACCPDTERDCCDTDFAANPGQLNYFSGVTTCGGYDYDCDGVENVEIAGVSACTCEELVAAAPTDG